DEALMCSDTLINVARHPVQLPDHKGANINLLARSPPILSPDDIHIDVADASHTRRQRQQRRISGEPLEGHGVLNRDGNAEERFRREPSVDVGKTRNHVTRPCENLVMTHSSAMRSEGLPRSFIERTEIPR